MNTRMQRYDNIPDADMSRTKRNQDIYKSTDMEELSRFKSNSNVSVISDAPKEIDIEKIKSYIDSMNDKKEEKRNRLDIELNDKNEEAVLREDTRTYDINSVLETAKENKEIDYEEERHRKINTTQYDILKSIKIEEEKNEEDEDDLNTQEKTIVDLIQNIQTNSNKEKDTSDIKDLFKDLMGDNENTVVMAPINEDEINKENMKEALNEITTDLEKIKEPINDETQDLILEKEKLKLEKEKKEKEIDSTLSTNKLDTIDKSFYTNSMSFSKTDFEGFSDLEEKSEKSSVFTKVAIVLAILLLLLTIFLILNFVLDWNLL